MTEDLFNFSYGAGLAAGPRREFGRRLQPAQRRWACPPYVVAAICIALFACTDLFAQVPMPPAPIKPAPRILKDIGIEQKLGAQVPSDLIFKDETGKDVRLGDYFGGDRPIILTLVYYKCPMLCTMVLNDLVRSMRPMNLSIGKDFRIVTVSFDPRETPDLAAAKRKQYLTEYRRAGADQGWHFLTGKQDQITKLTQAVGFKYAWDEGSQSFAHASGITILTPQGTVARYFYGIDYAPSDLRLSLVEASQKKIGSPTDRILLYCFHYDPRTGKYGMVVVRTVQAGGALTVLLLGGFIGLSLWRDRRGPPVSPPTNTPAGSA